MSAGPAPASHEEVEFKLLARAELVPAEVEEIARSLGLAVGPAQTVRQVDRYLDTDDLDLLRRGGALRLRSGAVPATLCFKGGAAPDGQALRRLEVEEPVADAATAPQSAAGLPRRLRDFVEPLTLSRSLAEIARVENDRARYSLLDLLSGARAELCIDRVHVPGSRDPDGGFVELEIEAGRGGAEAFAPLANALVERLGVQRAASSKLERALLASGQPLPLPHPCRPELAPGMPFREAAVRVLRVGFEALQTAEASARQGEDDEGVHRMRVATRRLRAALRIFAPAFGPTRLDVATRLFAQTGRVLGPVRDLDVMLTQLPRLSLDLPEQLAGELAPLFDLLVELREDRRRRMLAWLSSRSRLRAMDRFDRFLSRLESRCGIGAEPGATRPRHRGAGARPTGEVALALVSDAARRVFRRGDKVGKRARPEALHRLRIAVKRLRYTADALEDVVPEALVLWLKQTAELQDLLGAYNDAHVLEARLTAWIDTAAGKRLPRKTVLAVGGLIGAQEHRAREAKRGFRRQWREFSREKWRRRLAPAVEETQAGG